MSVAFFRKASQWKLITSRIVHLQLFNLYWVHIDERKRWENSHTYFPFSRLLSSWDVAVTTTNHPHQASSSLSFRDRICSRNERYCKPCIFHERERYLKFKLTHIKFSSRPNELNIQYSENSSLVSLCAFYPFRFSYPHSHRPSHTSFFSFGSLLPIPHAHCIHSSSSSSYRRCCLIVTCCTAQHIQRSPINFNASHHQNMHVTSNKSMF